jgi:hypothetical protein
MEKPKKINIPVPVIKFTIIYNLEVILTRNILQCFVVPV